MKSTIFYTAPSLHLTLALISSVLVSEENLFSQPYIDVVNVRLVKSPDITQPSKDRNSTTLDYFNVSTTLPFFLVNKKDAIVLSPFFEKWSSTVSGVDLCNQVHYGVALPVSLLKTIPHSTWSLLTTAIVRMNDMRITSDGKWQFGGAVLASNHLQNKNLTYKFGVYFNGEFFGLFIIPLLGIDWKISERTNLFGVLPASLTLEHKLNKHFFSGVTFRTFTNSYHDSVQKYWRIDENQLGVFADYYINKHIVLNLEAGYSLFRKIRSGAKDNITYNWNASDNPYFKLSLAYRIRTR